MSTLDLLKLFAEYNRLMNQRILRSASQLSEVELVSDRGAFFKSILGTLNHILVGDIIWLKRFSRHPASKNSLESLSRFPDPESPDVILFDDLDRLKKERDQIDGVIIDWLDNLSETDINDFIAYENMAGEPHKKQFSSLIGHLFLHQVHHRGQATTLLSQSGIDFGDTDLLEIISDYPV